MEQSASTTTRFNLRVERVIDAPRHEVWKAWTEPDRMKRWWGPTSFTAPYIEQDLRAGGKYLYAMRSPDGQDFWSTGTFREIVPYERIVATDSFADEKGNVVPGSYYGFGADFPLELLVTITFEDQGDKTRLTVRQDGFTSAADRDNAEGGWMESLDKLADSLKK